MPCIKCVKIYTAQEFLHLQYMFIKRVVDRLLIGCQSVFSDMKAGLLLPKVVISVMQTTV